MENFFLQPNVKSLKDINLNYKDLLVYAVLRSYRNKDTNSAYPSLNTISKKTKINQVSLRQALERLQGAKLITIFKGKYKTTNMYIFNELVRFKMIPVSLLDKEDISTEEKATLVSIRQFFHDDSLATSYNLTQISEILGIDYNTLQRHIKTLKEKELITDQLRYTVEIVDGQKIPVNKPHLILNEKDINWRLNNLEKNVEELKSENEDIKQAILYIAKQMNILPEQLFKALPEKNELLIGE